MIINSLPRARRSSYLVFRLLCPQIIKVTIKEKLVIAKRRAYVKLQSVLDERFFNCACIAQFSYVK